MRRDGMVREFEYQVRAHDGKVLWLSDSATVARDEAGEIIRYEGTVRDITDQRRAEDAIAEGRRLLQQVGDTEPAVLCGVGAGRRERPHHPRADVALRRGEDRRERQAGAGGGQGARI